MIIVLDNGQKKFCLTYYEKKSSLNLWLYTLKQKMGLGLYSPGPLKEVDSIHKYTAF